MLTDNHGRKMDYLRLAVTDRCNLRCAYCMPAEGITLLPKPEILSLEELLRLSSVLVKMGIRKIRITGGEPFVRKDVMQLMWSLSQMRGLRELTLTTNGILTAPLIPELRQMGISSVNLSLDTLDRNRFFTLTRRDELPRVLSTLEALLCYGFSIKLNAVVMDGKNTVDILPLVELTKSLPVDVRFIEEMPFNGGPEMPSLSPTWDFRQIIAWIREKYPFMEKIPDGPYSTSYNYRIPGHRGNVGVIAAYSRTFCGTCNRLRITPQGMLKTCLYDGGVLNMKSLLRNGSGDDVLQTAILDALQHREKTGWEVEKKRQKNRPARESMATIGG